MKRYFLAIVLLMPSLNAYYEKFITRVENRSLQGVQIRIYPDPMRASMLFRKPAQEEPPPGQVRIRIEEEEPTPEFSQDIHTINVGPNSVWTGKEVVDFDSDGNKVTVESTRPKTYDDRNFARSSTIVIEKDGTSRVVRTLQEV